MTAARVSSLFFRVSFATRAANHEHAKLFNAVGMTWTGSAQVTSIAPRIAACEISADKLKSQALVGASVGLCSCQILLSLPYELGNML